MLIPTFYNNLTLRHAYNAIQLWLLIALVIVGVYITSSQMYLYSEASLFKYLVFHSTNIYWNLAIGPLTTNALQQVFSILQNGFTVHVTSQAKTLGIPIDPPLLIHHI